MTPQFFFKMESLIFLTLNLVFFAFIFLGLNKKFEIWPFSFGVAGIMSIFISSAIFRNGIGAFSTFLNTMFGFLYLVLALGLIVYATTKHAELSEY